MLNKIQPNLANNQFGVLKGKSTSHALVAVLHTWCCALDAGESVRALFVDFSKAFDRVDHTLLLNKLLVHDVPCTLIRWLFSFLKDREQRVKIGQVCSKWCTLTAGFPQGTWLGPLAFITIIDDLQPPCAVHKFVDDTTFSEILASKNTPSRMDEFGGELERWSAQNHGAQNYIKINYTKTKEIVLGKIRN